MPFRICAELFDLLSGTCDSTVPRVPSHSQGQIKVKPRWNLPGPAGLCQTSVDGEATVKPRWSHAGHLDEFKLAAHIDADHGFQRFPKSSGVNDT